MTATILDGRAVAKTMQGELEAAVAEFKAKTGVTPTIAVVRAGEDPGSVWYANAIKKTMAARGMEAQLHILPETASQAELVDMVARLNEDPAVHGIMVQEPMPKGIDEGAVKAALSPIKDVDGVHEVNAGRLALAAPAGRPAGVGPFFVPATPAGGMELMRRSGVTFAGQNAVVLGRSAIVGKPMALLLMRENATVTVCHSRSKDLAGICRSADILCVAVGRAEMVKGDWIRPGGVVVDFGVNDVDGKMVGDVAYEEASEVAGMITPVPGGTGPMTNVMLCLNVLEAARLQV
ncbi:MAG: bifunctional 5,10-methylenetetrahydrofolate dehydrogenase/5,10-methenyltetrahydrofolate cyclohydrolase [Anaerolineae bacterium]|jgi:methylenetetrahydrofolate dehydrogenase (NADP+)/methenyltetrahydrofolate cyclohydrolase|nr:bifunctional 5,10-methylenetetrahydrofolate dehydrogenase/5,10-methenyltetrahydrofolate cyclohydrolase [Anaerolineae bacterium]MDX9829706.1 bifunctional 5,10-methylenetetrahydrofolate dehydrogenase/5,10-methenyltetrahydrofolate cyclohydrolase [Anaerolineae bacterium]